MNGVATKYLVVVSADGGGCVVWLQLLLIDLGSRLALVLRHMRYHQRFLVVLFAASVFNAASAEIRPPPTPSGFGWKRNLPVTLLRDKQVQRELGLNQQTVDEFEAIVAEITKSSPLTPNQGTLFLSIPDKYKSWWTGFLSDSQRSRLSQLELQQAPLLQVLCEPEVIKELKISSDQTDAICAIHKKDYYRNAAREAKDLDPIDDSAGIAKRLLSLLSPEQKRLLDDLKGRPLVSGED